MQPYSRYPASKIAKNTRSSALSAAEARHSANGARLFAHGAAFCVHSHTSVQAASSADTLMTAGSASAARTAAPSPCATATASDSASTEQRRRRRQHEPQHRAEHALSGLSGQLAQQRGQLERAVSLRRMQAGQAACRRAAQKHRAQEHKRRRAREGIKKTGNMPFVHTSPPFGSHRTAYSRSRSVRTLRLSPLRSASRTSCQRCRVRACTGTDARVCSPRRTRSVCRLHLDAEQRPSARSRQRCAR